MYKELTVKHDDDEISILSGHIDIDVNSPEFKNFFIEKHRFSKEELEKLKKQVNSNKVSILDSMYVDEKNRGQGHGSHLVSEFIDLCSSPIILIADIAETPWVENFYESFDFKTVFIKHGFPIMVLSEALDL